MFVQLTLLCTTGIRDWNVFHWSILIYLPNGVISMTRERSNTITWLLGVAVDELFLSDQDMTKCWELSDKILANSFMNRCRLNIKAEFGKKRLGDNMLSWINFRLLNTGSTTLFMIIDTFLYVDCDLFDRTMIIQGDDSGILRKT